jgi:hypothetical protein
MVDQPLHDPDPLKTIDIVEEHGSFLLIRAASGFAVVERRNSRIYPMKPGKREGVAMTTNAVAALLAEEGCFPEIRARRLLDDLTNQGERLAQCLR